jgi:Fe-S-cluster containining protein
MDYTAFIKAWCRWVPLTRETERLSLREKSNFDCIFWKGGCTVYKARPLQCRTFPFWDSVVCSEEAWNNTGKSCPGINTGTLHEKEKIEGFVRQLEEELVIERKIPRIN